MRALIAFILACLLAAQSQASNVTVQVNNIVSGTVQNRAVTITLTDPSGPAIAGPWLIAGDSVTQRTDSTGSTTFSNVLALGQYRCDVTGNPGRSFPFSVQDTNVTVNLTQLIGTNVFPQVFYNVTQITSLLAGNRSWVGSSNGTVIVYTNVNPATGTAFDLNVVGGGGGGGTNGIPVQTGTGYKTTLIGPTFYDTNSVSFTNAGNSFAGSGAALTALTGGNVVGTVASAAVAASLSTVITVANMTPALQLLNTNNGAGLTNLTAANLVGGPIPFGVVANETFTNPIVDTTATTGLRLRGPGPNAYDFRWFSGRLRLTNSVFNDWVDFNGGVSIGDNIHTASQINLWGANGSGPGNIDFTGILTGNVLGATNYMTNTISQAGVVPPGNGHISQFYTTDGSGNPGWNTYTPGAPLFSGIGSGENDSMIGVVGSGAKLYPTNSGIITATSAAQVNASGVLGGGAGGQLAQNTIATNAAFDGAFLKATGPTFKYTEDGSTLTNLSATSLPALRPMADWNLWNDTNGNYYALSNGLSILWISNNFAGLLQRVHDGGQQEYGLTLAVAACAKDGANLYPYWFSNTVNIYHDGVNIFGQGNPSTVFRLANTTNGPCFALGVQPSLPEDGIARFSNIRFEGSSGGLQGVGVRAVWAAEPIFEHCEFNSFGLAGVQLSGTNTAVQGWCYFDTCWFVSSTNGAGILCDSTLSYAFPELNIRNCDFYQFGAGRGLVVSNYMQNVAVKNCRFRYDPSNANPAAPAIDVKNGVRFSIVGNDFEWSLCSSPPIRFDNRASATNINSLVSGNTADPTNGFLIVGVNVSGLNISGNLTNNQVGYNGEGSGLTNLNASAFGSGILPQSVFPSVIPGGIFSNNTPSLGVTTAAGFIATNGTLAAPGAQQVSPAFRWGGNGWKTSGTPSSQGVYFDSYVLPVQGSLNAGAVWNLGSSIAGGALNNVLTYDQAGTLTSPGAINGVSVYGSSYVQAPSLLDGSSLTAFNVNNRIINDTASVVSIDANARALKNGGTNVLTWSGWGVAGNGSGLTALNASSLASGTIPIGVEPLPLQLLSTNYVGTGPTNSLGQPIANAIQGIIQSGATTNNNVVTLVGGSGVTTNWTRNTNVTVIANGQPALVVQDGLMVTNTDGQSVSATNGAVTASAGFAANGTGPWLSGSNAAAWMLLNTNGSAMWSNVTTSKVIVAWDTNGFFTMPTNYYTGGGSSNTATMGAPDMWATTFHGNATSASTATGLSGAAPWNLWASWLNLTNVPLQLYQLATNYMAGVTNSGGQFLTNPIFGIIEAGATTNNGVVTLPLNSQFTNVYYLQTNFISGQWYTNTYGSPIWVNVNVDLHTAAASGDSSAQLWIPGTVTNKVGISTTASTVVNDFTNELLGVVPAGSAYTFTNILAGAGNAANLSGGDLLVPGGTNITYFVGNGAGLTNLNGGAITGGVQMITWSALAIRPGDTLAGTWSTNTPGTTYNLLQSAGPSFLAWQISQAGTNNFLFQFRMPPNYAIGGAVTGAVSVLSATNFSTKVTNVWSFAGARVGTALGTAVTFTNNLPITTGTCNTNWHMTAGFTLAGTPNPGDDCYIQVSPWGSSPYMTTTNVEWLLDVSISIPTTNAMWQTLNYP